MRPSSSKISMSNIIFGPWGPLVAELCSILFFFPARGRFSGANFFRMTEYFLKSPFLGFLGFSGLEIFHGTILVKNQYVEHHFRPLGPLGGRVMVDFIFFSGPGTIFTPTPPDPKIYSPHAWCPDLTSVLITEQMRPSHMKASRRLPPLHGKEYPSPHGMYFPPPS